MSADGTPADVDVPLASPPSPPPATLAAAPAPAPGGGGGHLMAPAADTGAVGALAAPTAGRLHPAGGGGGSGDVGETLQAIKGGAVGFAALVRDRAARAGAAVRRSEAAATMKSLSLGAAGAVSKAIEATEDRIRRLGGGSLASICKAESAAVPCPRLVLVAAAAIAADAAAAARDGAFVADAPTELAGFLLQEMEAAQFAVLPPPGTSPAILATALKLWLASLPSPLLDDGGVPAFIGAGVPSAPPRAAARAAAGLPAAPRAALSVVVEAAARVAAVGGGPTPADLAAALTPCVAWHGGDPRPAVDGGGAASASASALPARRELTPQEAAAVARALEVLILTAADRAGGGEAAGPESPLGFFGE